MKNTYEEWLVAVKQEDNPDEYVLRTFHGVVEQYIQSSSSEACKAILKSAMECVQKYLKEKQ